MIAILDGGTTNTKCYIVDEEGRLLGEHYVNAGVKDRGEVEYAAVLREAIVGAVPEGASEEQLRYVVGFGMITSDLGLQEVPHAVAPVGLEQLRENIAHCVNTDILGRPVELFLIRGIKNPLEHDRDLKNIWTCDFMRGEETQVIGLLEKYRPKLPCNIIMLSSHSKVIYVDRQGQIANCRTTLSGQLYDSMANRTVLSKSIQVTREEPRTVTDEELIALAREQLNEFGVTRALLLPRFMEIFTGLTAEERRLFLDAIICIEDMQAMKDYWGDGPYATEQYFLIGSNSWCQLLAMVLQDCHPCTVTVLDGKEKNREISILGCRSICNAFKDSLKT